MTKPVDRRQCCLVVDRPSLCACVRAAGCLFALSPCVSIIQPLSPSPSPFSVSGLSICGHNCLLTAEWMSASKIVCRVGPAKDDKGEIIVTTKSGGLGTSTVSFKLLRPERIGKAQRASHQHIRSVLTGPVRLLVIIIHIMVLCYFILIILPENANSHYLY